MSGPPDVSDWSYMAESSSAPTTASMKGLGIEAFVDEPQQRRVWKRSAKAKARDKTLDNEDAGEGWPQRRPLVRPSALERSAKDRRSEDLG